MAAYQAGGHDTTSRRPLTDLVRACRRLPLTRRLTINPSVNKGWASRHFPPSRRPSRADYVRWILP